jgi:hypothetical protein
VLVKPEQETAEVEEKTFRHYVKDLGHLLKERALEAKLHAQGSSDLYDRGLLMAFYEVVSLMQSQASAFGIEFDDVGLADIHPDSDLL